jgi:hypothetical protein
MELLHQRVPYFDYAGILPRIAACIMNTILLPGKIH